MALKPLDWIGSSLDDLRAFPTIARQRAGFELYRVQKSLDPTDWKPMTSIGPGVREIRIQTGREHRIFYIASFRRGDLHSARVRKEVPRDTAA